MDEQKLANLLFECFLNSDSPNLISDEFKSYEPGASNHFWIVHPKSGKKFKVIVHETNTD